ncbi:DUF6549 family protein [Bacteroides fragilis]
MNRILVKCLLAAVLVLGGIVWVQHRNAVRLRTERDRYRDNTETLLSDMKRIRVDSTTMAVDVNALRLRVDEYKRLRAEDAEQIKRLGVKIKNLEAAARHEVEVAGPIDAAVRDTVVIRDTVPLLRQKVEMITPYIQLTGLIEKGRLKGEIRVSVTLRQAVWVEYKGWWFWKKVKAVHQTISSDNPYAEIRYSEYIEIHKKIKTGAFIKKNEGFFIG